jgi:hypothetical protein
VTYTRKRAADLTAALNIRKRNYSSCCGYT